MVTNAQEDWRNVSMSEVKTELETARGNGKYLLIWD